MKTNKQLIDEVNGTMNIEGMPLTEADRKRMEDYLNEPSKFEDIIRFLIEKHTVYADRM